MPEAPTTRWIALAHLLRPQGRKGEVLADLLTDFPDRFETQPDVFLASEGFVGTPDQARAFSVAAFWLPVGRNNGRIVLHFAGIDSIGAAESLSGLDVLIPEAERPELEDGASYVSDLIGCTLYDMSANTTPYPVGIVTDVQFPTSPDGARRLEEAAPLLAVETETGDEVLVPFVQAFIVSLDTAAKRIEMSLPSGLTEVNR